MQFLVWTVKTELQCAEWRAWNDLCGLCCDMWRWDYEHVLLGTLSIILSLFVKEDVSELTSVSIITCNDGPAEYRAFLTQAGGRIRSTSQNMVFENKLKLMDNVQNTSYVYHNVITRSSSVSTATRQRADWSRVQISVVQNSSGAHLASSVVTGILYRR